MKMEPDKRLRAMLAALFHTAMQDVLHGRMRSLPEIAAVAWALEHITQGACDEHGVGDLWDFDQHLPTELNLVERVFDSLRSESKLRALLALNGLGDVAVDQDFVFDAGYGNYIEQLGLEVADSKEEEAPPTPKRSRKATAAT